MSDALTPQQTIAGVLEFAHDLIGSRLSYDGVAVEITEVEAYAGPLDPASHAYTRTPRSETMYGPPMRLYVYFSYGMHWCVNVVWGPEGTGAGVLLRAGRVVEGLDHARTRRGAHIADRKLASGPANLTRTLGIDGADNGHDLREEGGIHLTMRTSEAPPIASGPRVGIAKAADEPWRFWVEGDRTVSAYRRSPRAPVVSPED